LPYQEGKIEHGRRVGTWYAYFRNAKKQVQYSITYNNEGILNATVERFDTNGFRLITKNYTRNILNGITIGYENNKIAYKEVYFFGNKIETIFYNTSGKVYKEMTTKGDTITTIEYAPQSDKIIHKLVNVFGANIDSIFNENGALIAHSIYDNYGNVVIKSSLGANKQWFTQHSIAGNNVCATQKAYLAKAMKANDANEYFPSMYSTAATGFDYNKSFKNKDSILMRLQAFKTMRLSPSLTMANYRKPIIINLGEKDEMKQLEIMTNMPLYANEKNAFTSKQYTIKDQFGQTITFLPILAKEPIVLILNADSLATPTQYNPITSYVPIVATINKNLWLHQKDSTGNDGYTAATAAQQAADAAAAAVRGAANSVSVMGNVNEGDTPSIKYTTEDYFTTLCRNKSIAALVSAKGGLRTTWQVPANVLHPANIKEDAAFVLDIDKIHLVKTYPHTFQNELNTHLTEDYQTKAQQIAACNAMKKESIETMLLEKTPTNALQIYTIGSTNMRLIPTSNRLIKGCPIQENRTSTDFFTPLRYANHQALDKNDNIVCDAYLQQQKIRLIANDGFMDFSPAIKNYIAVFDVLIDNEEVNGSFLFNTDKINLDALLAQCSLQHIDIVFCELGTIKVIPFDKIKKGAPYAAHFRYKAR
jgi:hypothetical protein